MFLSPKHYENTGIPLPNEIVEDLCEMIAEGKLYSNLLHDFYRVELKNFRSEYEDFLEIKNEGKSSEFWLLRDCSLNKILKINREFNLLYEEAQNEEVERLLNDEEK